MEPMFVRRREFVLAALGVACMMAGLVLSVGGLPIVLLIRSASTARGAAHGPSHGVAHGAGRVASQNSARGAQHGVQHTPPHHTSSLGVHANAMAKVLWLSDFHLNPFYTKLLGPSCKCMSYGPYWCDEERDWALPWPPTGACVQGTNGNPWGQFGCDTPFILAESAIAAARAACPEPMAVLVTGDYVAHESCQFPVTNPRDESVRIVRELSATVSAAFEHPEVKHVHHPTQQLTATMGNDDFVPDYLINGKNATDGRLADAPLPSLVRLADALSPQLDELQRYSFVRGGGVRYELGKLVVLSLNTVVYSRTAAHITGQAAADPFGQFAWLEAQLSAVHKHRGGVIITGHIPPTIDQFSFSMEWLQPYADAYVRIVARHANVVSAQLFGHTHQNMVRAFPAVPDTAAAYGDGPALLVSAAVSPIYGNNPTFSVLELKPSSAVLHDLTVHTVQLSATGPSLEPQWAPLYSARERYAPYDILTSKGLRAFAVALMSDDELFSAYLHDRLSGAPGWDKRPGSGEFSLGREAGELRLASRRHAAPSPAGSDRYRTQMACSVAFGFSEAAFDACVARGGPSFAAGSAGLLEGE